MTIFSYYRPDAVCNLQHCLSLADFQPWPARCLLQINHIPSWSPHSHCSKFDAREEHYKCRHRCWALMCHLATGVPLSGGIQAARNTHIQSTMQNWSLIPFLQNLFMQARPNVVQAARLPLAEHTDISHKPSLYDTDLTRVLSTPLSTANMPHTTIVVCSSWDHTFRSQAPSSGRRKSASSLHCNASCRLLQTCRLASAPTNSPTRRSPWLSAAATLAGDAASTSRSSAQLKSQRSVSRVTGSRFYLDCFKQCRDSAAGDRRTSCFTDADDLW